jgi:heme-degrading monooxygenase HmoA
MWARVTRFEEPTNRIDDDIRDSRGAIAELIRRVPGSRGVYYLVDRDTGHTMAVTLWETEEAMRASEDEAARLREESTARVGARVVSVERFEVALEPSDVLTTAR